MKIRASSVTSFHDRKMALRFFLAVETSSDIFSKIGLFVENSPFLKNLQCREIIFVLKFYNYPKQKSHLAEKSKSLTSSSFCRLPPMLSSLTGG